MLSHQRARTLAQPRCHASAPRRLSPTIPVGKRVSTDVNTRAGTREHPCGRLFLPVPSCEAVPSALAASGSTRQVSASAPGRKVLRACPNFPHSHSELSLVVAPLL